MHLKKLELQGFKSFPDKTVITFDKGLTVIVGPNGSGKSNISDAMRWVLGEISSKNIRGAKMEDVIFAGSSGRSPMSFAEVSVTFDNSDPEGKIATAEDYDEITVTRRYYRVGESEYFINRKPVRLKDIHELFLNTGLGRGGYSIIGQGKIAEIISRKNEERRAVFEEAAGIAKYKYQKQEATHNLEQTEANLTRLEDITGELEARIGPLEKESARAKKYLELYDRKKAVDIALSLYDIDGAKARTAELRELFAVSTQNLETAEGRLAEEEAKETALSEKQSAERLESERIAEEIALRTEDRHNRESGILVCEKENGMYAEQRETARGKLTAEKELADVAEKELADKQSELSAAEEKKAEKEAELAALDDEIASYGESLAKAESDDTDTAQKKADLGKSSVDARVQISALNAEKEADGKKLAALTESTDKHDADIALYEKRMEEADGKLASLAEKEAGLLSELEKTNAEKAEKEALRAEAERQKNENYLEVSQRRHKMQNLIRMDELLEGFSRAVRFVVTEYEAGRIPGRDGKQVILHGPLSKLISADERYAVALETAFGQNLQNIVAENEASAKSAIDYLKRKNAGRATFYPIDTMHGTELDAGTIGVAGRPGFVAVASTLVKCDAPIRGIVKGLVGRILIADTMDHASAMAKALDYRYRVVTLDGQVINAGGSFTGGSVATESQFLSRRSEIEKLGTEIAELEKAGKKWESKRDEAEKAVEETQKKASSVSGSLTMVRKLIEAESTQRQVLAANRDMLCEARETVRAEAAELENSIRACTDKIASLEREQGQYSMESMLLDLKETELKTQREELREKLDELADRRSDLMIELAKESTNMELLSSVMEAVRGKSEVYRASVAALEETIGTATDKIRANEERMVLLKAEAESLAAWIAEREEKRSALSLSGMETEKELHSLRAAEKETSATKEILVREHAKLESELESVSGKADELLSFLWDDYELSYTEAQKLCAEPITKATRPAAVTEQNKLKNSIKNLGNVNVGAIEEYREVSERYGQMHEQIEDLHRSRDSLMKNISELEQRMCVDFVSTMERVNDHFGKVFSELFGGGHAEVKLSDPENVLESGIEINVAPPGKVIKSLSLLSGGEQAFVAIALYFAILKVNPSPFCIMDEIEAALDEVNVDKFADYVKNYSDKTQFVLITHRRGTMEVAERLYGVTMHEKGISDILSVDVSEIEQRIGKAWE